MIKLEKRPPTPKSLKSSTVEKAERDIANKIKAGIRLNSNDFKASHWKKKDIKNTLSEYQHNKCCYCERMRDSRGELQVDHFRPKTEVKNEPEHPGYWWLAYRWDNLVLACGICNGIIKSSYFPLLPGGKRAFSEADNLKLELPV